MLGVYVHTPFCVAVCPYCDFNVYTGIEDTAPAYFAAMLDEARARAAAEATEPAVSIFFGGGTPSMVDPSLLASFLTDLRTIIPLQPDAEITMEANPERLTVDGLRLLRNAGINRLSLGVQSFAPHVLTALGRAHTPQIAKDAFAAARDAGFDNVSLDLIFGGPGETLEEWRASLMQARSLEPEHVSAYGLMIEPGTAFGTAVNAGRMQPPDEDLQADKYELACDLLDGHYEISNWGARPSAHNLVYWMQGDYIGLGAGAHSHRQGVRWWNHKRPATYSADPANAIAGSESLDDAARGREWVLLRLRLVAGLPVAEAEARMGHSLAAEAESLVADGLATLEQGTLRLTRRGLLLESAVALRLGAA